MDDFEAEAERILAMSDEEILARAVGEGTDIELVVSEVQAMIELAIMRKE